MRLLAIDTCLGACSCAVTNAERALAVRSEAMMRGHQERLAPMVAEAMAEAHLAFSQLDRIAVTIGPGSFTGLRVGLAFAKGLAFATGAPLAGVGTLQALAATAAIAGPAAAVIDAGRGRVYVQAFDGDAARTAPEILALEDAAASLAGADGLTLTGPGAGLLATLLPAARSALVAAPSPLAVARLATGLAPGDVRPLYLRAPDAKPKAA